MFVFGSDSLAVKPAPISSVDTFGWHAEKKKLAEEKILPALKAAQGTLRDATIDAEVRRQLLSPLVPDLLRNASSLQKSLELSRHRDEKAFAGAIAQLGTLARKIENGDWSTVGSAIKAVEKASVKLSELSKPQAETRGEKTSLTDVTPKMMKPIDVLKFRSLDSLNDGSGSDFNFKGSHKTAEQQNTVCIEAVDLAVELKILTPAKRYKIMEVGVDPIKEEAEKSNLFALATAVFGVGRRNAHEMFRIAEGLSQNDVNVAVYDPTQRDSRLNEQGVSSVVEALDRAVGLSDSEYRLWKWAMMTIASGKDIARERIPKLGSAKMEKEAPREAEKKERPKPAARISEPVDLSFKGADSPVFAKRGEAFEGDSIPKRAPPWEKKHFVPEGKAERQVAKAESKEPVAEEQKAPKLEAMPPRSRDYSASRNNQVLPGELAYVQTRELKRIDIAEARGKMPRMEEKPKVEKKESGLSDIDVPVEKRAIKPSQRIVQEAKRPEAGKKELPKPAARISEPVDLSWKEPESQVIAKKGEAFEGASIPKMTPPWEKKHFVPERKAERQVAKAESKEPVAEEQKAPKLEAMQPRSRDYSASRNKVPQRELPYVQVLDLKPAPVNEAKVPEGKKEQEAAKEEKKGGKAITVSSKNVFAPYQKEAGGIKWLMELGENKPENQGVRIAFDSMNPAQKAAFIELIKEIVDANPSQTMNAVTLEKRVNLFKGSI